jgi:uncharacterized protein (TIGR04255 family)
MTSYTKRYKSPPIKEAIFTVAFKEPLSDEIIDSFKDKPFIKSKFVFETQRPGVVIKISDNSDTKVSHRESGYLLKGENTLLRVNPTQISYHILSKYDSWETAIEEMNNIWNEFKTASPSPTINQIAVRYINQILLPTGSNVIEYFKLLPSVPQGFGTKINNFFLQINTTDIENKLNGVITETFLPPNQTEGVSFLLDINVSKNIQCLPDSQEIWETFDKIRTFKNKLFVSCITEKTELLFNV